MIVGQTTREISASSVLWEFFEEHPLRTNDSVSVAGAEPFRQTLIHGEKFRAGMFQPATDPAVVWKLAERECCWRTPPRLPTAHLNLELSQGHSCAVFLESNLLSALEQFDI
jgi:hypothetical protein